LQAQGPFFAVSSQIPPRKSTELTGIMAQPPQEIYRARSDIPERSS
jgi:hypothetical protein